MGVWKVKSIAGAVGGAAVIAAAVVCLLDPAATEFRDIAGGSGDSATGTQYTQPKVPAMSLGDVATTTTDIPVVETAPTTLATSVASPTFKAAPPSGF